MSEFADKALLPAGMCDVLPPDAENEAVTMHRLIAVFTAHGYDRVKPPLIEFEDSLLSGNGAAMGEQTLRLGDPVSQKMMAIRADMTLQVARIAATRLKKSPRPLRLCYGGQVLRVRGTQLRPERQFGQVGVELIGADDAAADAEVIFAGVEALEEVGIGSLSVDISMPALVTGIISGLDIDKDCEIQVRAALNRKDSTAVADLSGTLGKDTASLLTSLLDATGEADQALGKIAELKLPKAAQKEFKCLSEVVGKLRRAMPDLKLTVDPVESRGFEYHSGVTFSFFANGVRGELGSGGRYITDGQGATGLTLFMDTIMRTAPKAEPSRRIYLAPKTDADQSARLRDDGWITIAGLADGGDDDKEAKRLGCTHIYSQGETRKI